MIDSRRPRVHVVCDMRSDLGHVLRVGLFNAAHVVIWTTPPQASRLAERDLLVLDLLDLPEAYVLEASVVAHRVDTILVYGDDPVDPRWVELLSQGVVTAVRVPSRDHRHWFDSVIGVVMGRILGPSAAFITSMVIDREPGLEALEDYVRAVCMEPWMIRRPRDLARQCGATVGAVRLRCVALGFNRIEHFILCVRMVAYEQLVAKGQIAHAAARRVVGLGDDRSNLRRHLNRAIHRSPAAAGLFAAPKR